ncbi:MAG: hypothetical protein RLZZ59_873 [Pseudomonadota bacterium]|jgi:hypothetical protein
MSRCNINSRKAREVNEPYEYPSTKKKPLDFERVPTKPFFDKKLALENVWKYCEEAIKSFEKIDHTDTDIVRLMHIYKRVASNLLDCNAHIEIQEEVTQCAVEELKSIIRDNTEVFELTKSAVQDDISSDNASSCEEGDMSPCLRQKAHLARQESIKDLFAHLADADPEQSSQPGSIDSWGLVTQVPPILGEE